jgi:hypothetical protein
MKEGNAQNILWENQCSNCGWTSIPYTRSTALKVQACPFCKALVFVVVHQVEEVTGQLPSHGCNDKVCWYAKCEKPERVNCEAHNLAVREIKLRREDPLAKELETIRFDEKELSTP